MTSQPADSTPSDEQKIHALIDAWGEASEAGDLTAQMQLMTEDVVFLTSGSAPMHRKQFAEAFSAMVAMVHLTCRSNVQEITISWATSLSAGTS